VPGPGSSGTFEISKDKHGEFRFQIKAGNGEIVATGQSDKTWDHTKRGVEGVKRAAAGRQGRRQD